MIVYSLCAGHTVKEMQNWLKGNLTEVWVEEVWLPSLPACKPFDCFVYGVSELRVKAKSRNKSKGSDPQDEGGDGVPCQGHPGKGMHEWLSSQLMVVLLNMFVPRRLFIPALQ